MRRIERLINLIAALLETSRPLSAEDIRRDVAGYDQANHEAFRRAFERDKEALRGMGVPIELRQTQADPFSEQLDGYIIPKDSYYLPEIDLEQDELAALRLAAAVVLGAGEQAGEGLLKLSMNEATSSSIPRVPWGADVGTEAPAIGALYGALLARVPVRFGYRTAQGAESERHVEPYGLVHRRGDWYVVGRDRDRDAVRSFKIGRISTNVATGSGGYVIPDDFEADSHLAGEGFEIGDETEVAVIRFTGSLAWWPSQNMQDAEITSVSEDATDVRIPVGNIEALVSWVVSFGDEVEVIEPPAARAAVLEHLQPLLGEGA